MLYNRNHYIEPVSTSATRNCPYNMRDRTRDRELIEKETGLEKEFIARMLFKYSYWRNDCVSD